MIEKNIFFTRLDDLVKLSGNNFNQTERKLNYPRNALHNYKYGGEPSASRLIELATYFNVSPYYLIGKSEENLQKSTKEIFEQLDKNQQLEMYKISQEWMLSKVEEKSSLRVTVDKERRETGL